MQCYNIFRFRIVVFLYRMLISSIPAKHIVIHFLMRCVSNMIVIYQGFKVPKILKYVWYFRYRSIDSLFWISYECSDEGTCTPNIRNSSTRNRRKKSHQKSLLQSQKKYSVMRKTLECSKQSVVVCSSEDVSPINYMSTAVKILEY